MARCFAAAVLREEARFGKTSADTKLRREIEQIADDLAAGPELGRGGARVWSYVRRAFARLGLGTPSAI